MTDRELLAQALEALEFGGWNMMTRVITTLRERLAQPEQTVSMDEYTRLQELVTSQGIRLMEYESAQPVQEPVDNAEKAGAYLNARLWEFIDMAAAWPEAKPDPRTLEHVLVYAPKQPQMQPCAGRNCGSTNPDLHSAECFEDYENATGMNQRKPLTNDRVWLEYMQLWPFRPNEEPTLAKDILRFARAIEAAHGIGEKPDAA